MEVSPKEFRHTKIITTIGPATQCDAELQKLILAGVDIMRLNMAHATDQWVAEVVARIRAVSENVGRHVAVMMDVKGPEIRTGPLNDPIPLTKGQRVEFHTGEVPSPSESVARVSVNYPGLVDDVDVGATMLVDSGLIRLRVLDKGDTYLTCEVITSGTLGSRRHINLPGVTVNLPALTSKDETDLRAGVEAEIDFVALSFVRQASDIDTLRRFLADLGSTARVVAKIEDQAGVRNMVEIVEAADAIMVARGDLGIEIGQVE